MYCPYCGRETSEMSMACEWCHTPIHAQYPPGPVVPPPSHVQIRRVSHPVWTWLKIVSVSLVGILAFFLIAYMLIGWRSSKEIAAHPELVVSGKPTVVMFYSSSGSEANPQMSAMVGVLTGEFSGKVEYERIITAVDPGTMKLYNLDVTPSFISLTSKGNLIQTLVGTQDEATMRDFFERAASNDATVKPNPAKD